MPVMVPQPATAIPTTNFLRLLLLGAPKIGKTTVSSQAPGPVYIIKSDPSEDCLKPAKEAGVTDFLFNDAHSRADMEGCVKVAHDLIKAGTIRTVVWDAITDYSESLAEECLAASENDRGVPDGRQAWQAYHSFLSNCVTRLLNLKCHVIVNAHYMNMSDGGVETKGISKIWKPGSEGIVPLLYGQSRMRIPKLFSDVVFFEKLPGNKRVFVTDADGIFGPGCRNLKGVSVVDPASIGELLRLMGKDGV